MKEKIDRLMKYIKGMDETEVLKEIQVGEVPPIHKGFSTAIQEKYYKEIRNKWELSSNTVVGEEIWSRSYTELIFEEGEKEEVYVKEISLEEYDEELGGREFYVVTHSFYEEVYKGNKPFFRWNKERMVWQQEIYYHNRKEGTIRWERGKNIYTNPDGGEEVIYERIEEGMRKKLKSGQALGVVIRSDGVFNLRVGDRLYRGIKESPKISPLGEEEIEIEFNGVGNQRLEEREIVRYEEVGEEGEVIEIRERWYRVEPREVIPKYIEIDIYGTEEARAGRKYHPKGEEEEYREILIHAQGTEYRERMIPPGKEGKFKEEFWNTEDVTRTSRRYKNYSQRRGREPKWE